jgi:hypothetical protein
MPGERCSQEPADSGDVSIAGRDVSGLEALDGQAQVQSDWRDP